MTVQSIVLLLIHIQTHATSLVRSEPLTVTASPTTQSLLLFRDPASHASAPIAQLSKDSIELLDERNTSDILEDDYTAKLAQMTFPATMPTTAQILSLLALCVASVRADDDTPTPTTAPVFLPEWNAESWSLVRGSVIATVCWTML